MRGKAGLLIGVLITALMFTACGSGGGGGGSTTPGGTSTDTTAPSIPAGLTAVAASATSISLNWSVSTDDVGVTGYRIYRGGTQIAMATNSAYSDTGLSSSTTYTYTVCAYDAAANNSAQSGAAGATTLAAGQADTQPPTAPTNLTATAVSSSQINLSWTASTDNIAVAGYEVWRGSTKVATVTTNSYSDIGLAASTSYTYTVKAFDGASNISTASTIASATTPAAGVGSGSLRVRVTGNDDTLVQNATVVLGNSNGGMISFGTTDANGEYTFSNPPANATVTAAYSCVYSGSTNTNYSLPVLYDVNVAAVTLNVNNCNLNQTTALGTITVNATNSIGAAVYWEVYIGYSGGNGSNVISSQTYTVYPSMLQSDGKLSVVVIAKDGSYNPIGYGTVLDQTFVNGMAVNIDVNQTFSYVQYTLNNIPATVKSVGDQLTMNRKDAGIYVGDWGLSSTSTSTILSVPYIPGFGDTFEYYAGVNLDQNSNGNIDSQLWLGNFGIQASTPSDQTFDFSQMPAIPSNVTVSYATGTATPTFSWTGSDASANDVSIYGYANVAGGAGLNLDMYASPTRTSVVFPELPPALAAFRPATVQSLSVNNLVNSLFAGYNDYLTTMDQWATAGTATIPPGTSKQTGGAYSSSQSLAPQLNKTSLSSTSRVPKKRYGM